MGSFYTKFLYFKFQNTLPRDVTPPQGLWSQRFQAFICGDFKYVALNTSYRKIQRKHFPLTPALIVLLMLVRHSLAVPRRATAQLLETTKKILQMCARKGVCKQGEPMVVCSGPCNGLLYGLTKMPGVPSIISIKGQKKCSCGCRVV